MKDKILIIGTVGVPANYGGFETLTENIVKNISDYDITVYCSGKEYRKKRKTYGNAKLVYLPLKANGIQSIPYDILSMFHALLFNRVSKTWLILGVSGCMILPVIKLFTRKTIIVNIDGLEWKRDKWNKFAKWFLKTSEKIAVKYSDYVIADNKAIQDYVLAEYNKKSELIEYGGDHAKQLPLTSELSNTYPFLNQKYAFKVCRIEPENNLHIILKAFKQYSKLNLIIIGNWNNSEYGIDLKNKYNKISNIFLLDPIYDKNILDQIRSNAYIYVHGHSAGGTNPSLVEAMYLQLPIIAYDISYNRETTKNQAFYFKDTASLLDTIKNISKTELDDNRKKIKEIADQNYKWEIILKKYNSILKN